MEPADIARSYDAIAHRWLEPHLATNGILQHERALQFRPGGGRALDVGCGCNERFPRLFESRGYEVEGLDLSAEMIALARQRNPTGRYLHADVCEWLPSVQYDFITAWDSIWHVPLDRSERVLRTLLGALNPDGVMIWTTGGVDGPEEKVDASMGPPVYYGVPGIPAILAIVNETGCVCRHLEYDQHPESHVYLIAQKRSPSPIPPNPVHSAT